MNRHRKAVDVKEDGKWMTFPSMGQAATYLGVSIPTLSKHIESGKILKNCYVKMHADVPEEDEIDLCLKEIDERNKQPYEFSNGRKTPAFGEEPQRMTHTELITRLYEHTAELEELRTQFRTEWLIDTRLKDVTSRLQMLMKEIQEGGAQ